MSMIEGPFDAFHLPPELAAGLETSVQRFGPPHEAIELRLPTVTPGDLTQWIGALAVSRRERLAPRSVASIIRSLERVARRFLDPGDTARSETLHWLTRAGKFSAPMVERAIEDVFQPLARGGIKRWVDWELGSAAMLDQPVADRSGHAYQAHGPEWMLQIYAGNVPGLPAWPIYAALLMKSAVLAKTASQEPVLAPLLARTVAEVDADLGACLAIVWWKGGSNELDRTALHLAPAVLAFGGEPAIASIARLARPDAKLVLHGPKVSVAYIAREALTPASLRRVAARTAHDVALYDQEGCLSPHAVYVERGGRVAPGRFAVALGGALDELRLAMPRRTPEASQAARIQLYRAQATFEAAAGHRGTQVNDSGAGTHWTVVFEEGARFEPSPTHRTVRVHAIEGPEDALEVLRPAIRYLEAIALEARGKRLAGLLAALAATGVPRVAELGALQRPSPLGTHGGTLRLMPFLTWSTVEGRVAGVRRGPNESRSRRKAP